MAPFVPPQGVHGDQQTQCFACLLTRRPSAADVEIDRRRGETIYPTLAAATDPTSSGPYALRRPGSHELGEAIGSHSDPMANSALLDVSRALHPRSVDDWAAASAASTVDAPDKRRGELLADRRAYSLELGNGRVLHADIGHRLDRRLVSDRQHRSTQA